MSPKIFNLVLVRLYPQRIILTSNLHFFNYIRCISRTSDQSPESERAQQLEVEGVQLAESSDLSAALDKFNEAVLLCPDRASCYNNRAQAYRLKGDNESNLHINYAKLF